MAPKGKGYEVEWPPGCEKLGAGFAFSCGQEVLLLKRSPNSGNPLTWGLPGGNVDKTDESLLFAAKREAVEEMEQLPEGFEVVREVTTRRGKRLQKWYKVFVARISEAVKEAYKPALNDEHTEYKWVDVKELHMLNLHPVVSLLFSSTGELPVEQFQKLMAPVAA
ncbi:Nudix hydrolase domain-containing protein [Chloropicon primus]|uniref:Nudix hydrolase domain-containing protein n=1 Tax=Chloropicon primus TaxID=1764295 RepID=A0A5B8MH35_9CHLO|nr:hypothetical protein A3770_03p22740 [Chloropicon primus]UPQ98967.1 Nudix hydrolase domain-containing protein [Chloropicon primus]|mmetsp:Transcript_5445/g.16507  ORF Transcript_5445/g.16507 Transcript_5445/m.16507 type:complete len:165 (+) Transcript_5445:1606-2100(+)|eukprot:QDZ19756.1 hypothetical protein A3770_03p22740 [Chloropicon primus]